MELTKLASRESLVTEVSGEVTDFAAFLDIPYNIHSEDDHIYIKKDYLLVELASFHFRRDSDVMVSPQVFCEILMDIKSGLTLLEAFNKQGYTFNH